MTNTIDLDALVKEYTDLQARGTEITDRLNQIKGDIAANLDVGKYDAAGLVVTVRERNRVFDLNAAVAMLPELVKPRCRKEVYDAAEVKKHLAPVVTEACMKPGSGKRIVSIS